MERYIIVSRQDALDLGADIPTDNQSALFVVEQVEEGLACWFDCDINELLVELNSVSDELDKAVTERNDLEKLQDIYDQLDKGGRKRSGKFDDDEWD